ncbi:hypothetical protein OKA05_06635 [Luteolibacter arcticus]|uniref:Uncharacterized protein n=1 Tax=Luteolibacter arcticus TaxID=1581411 RepID=A0ABT3GF39_9BACT|nr:hypothetical protein [Luteolibacter arcticus]MCW1922222.1 hypothetical protein [Luteolibacter arcticus]
MKPIPQSFLSRATVLLLVALSAMACPASNVVMSNLFSAEGSSTTLTDSSGALLASGSLVQLGTFPGLGEAGVAALALHGPVTLMSGIDGFGSAFGVGAGAGNAEGRIEITANEAVGIATGELYAVILNAPTVEAATEVLVLKLADSVPADDASSLPGYLAVHLRDAEVVFGAQGAGGFSTQAATIPTSFDAWILGQLGEDSDPTLRSAGADADGDGLTNLLEYGLGSLAGDSSSRPRIEIQETSGEYHVLSLRRMDDPALVFACEVQADLSEIVWPLLETPLLEAANPPVPAPDGHQWMQQRLPSGSRAFVRLKVTAEEAP